MNRKIIILILLLTAVLTGCELDIAEVKIPEIKDTELKGTKEVNDLIVNSTTGIYFNTSSDNPFGDTVVIKWSGRIKKTMTIFTGRGTNYIVLDAGYKQNEIIFEGYWRQANTDLTGIARMKITPENGGKALVDGLVPATIKLTGSFDPVNNQNSKQIEFVYVKKINLNDKFYIIAHKGGGRNIDRLPHPENSIEIIEYAEKLGANAIEIDVQLTKDKVPVLFHDEHLSKRTINEDYFIGKVSDYSYKTLNTFVTLKSFNGNPTEEKIPTLEDALESIVKNTNIKLVWLDIKNPEAIQYVLPFQQKYSDIEIMIGIPDITVYEAIKRLPNYKAIATICELDEQYVNEIGAQVWAPRWSMGLLIDRIQKIHNDKKRCFVWTMDDQNLIRTYLRESNFDGIVTNYSPVVAFEYYNNK